MYGCSREIRMSDLPAVGLHRRTEWQLTGLFRVRGGAEDSHKILSFVVHLLGERRGRLPTS